MVFVPGATLSRRLHEEVVGPLMAERFPGLPWSSALLGRGSEVLGYDDEMSTDHDWTARLLVFVADDDTVRAVAPALHDSLPVELAGRPVAVEVHTVRDYLQREIGLDVAEDVRAADWLTLPEHGLCTVTAGAVFHDEVGLDEVRSRLAYYPRDVWLYLLVGGWWRVHPEMNLAGRAGAAGDELGSSLIGARIVTDLMRLCFLMEQQYAPYSKWFGTAFARLDCGPDLVPLLAEVGRADGWRDRETRLNRVYERLIELHNSLGLTPPLVPEVVQMWDRPFAVAWAGIPDLLVPLIEDSEVASIAERWPVGPVDRFRELVWAPRHRTLLTRLFEDADQPGAAPSKLD